MTHALFPYVSLIENHLRTFYPIDHAISANDYILDPYFSHDAVNNKRAAVVSIECEEGFQNIGIYFSQSLIEQHTRVTPQNLVTTMSLDSHCAIIEEISHFHLLAHRTQYDQPVTRLELETQAEIDKFLICATMLLEQTGDAHFHSLARCLYDNGLITDLAHRTIYEDANRFAANFWLNRIRGISSNTDLRSLRELRLTLHQMFLASFQEKLPFFEPQRRGLNAA